MQTFVSKTDTRSGLRNQDLNIPGLTQGGKEWLKAALDPFHDSVVDVSGLPDTDTSRVTVEVIKKSFQLSAPAGTAGNWAAHIFSLPHLSPFIAKAANTRYGLYSQQSFDNGTLVKKTTAIVNQIDNGVSAIALGALNIHAWTTDQTRVFPDGQDSYTVPPSSRTLDAVPGEMTQVSSNGQDFFPARYASSRRMIAAGFEIHNTTAEIYKQGTITVSRVPRNVRRDGIVNVVNDSGTKLVTDAGNSTTTTAAVRPGTCTVSGPPGSIIEALSYSGTRQWAAADGVYVPLVQDCMKNPLQTGGYEDVAVKNNDIIHSTDGQPQTCFASEGCTYNAANANVYQNPASYIQTTPFDVSSVILSGLSQQSTFTIEVTFVVETAPHLFDPDMGLLTYTARPSPPHDPRALEIYQRVATQMPTGVKVSMNPAGEFWAFIKSLAMKAAPFVSAGLSALPNPLAKGAAALIDVAVKQAKEAKRVAIESKAVADNAKVQAELAAKLKARK